MNEIASPQVMARRPPGMDGATGAGSGSSARVGGILGAGAILPAVGSVAPDAPASHPGHLLAGKQTRWEAKRAERRAKIAAMFQPGARVSEVAAALGSAFTTAATAMREMGWPIAGRGAPTGQRAPRPGSLRRRQQILAAVQADPRRTLASFGAEFGITHQRVQQIIAAAGLGFKPKTRSLIAEEKRRKVAAARQEARNKRQARRDTQAAQVLALLARGYTWAGAAEELGVSMVTIARRCQHAKAHGITVDQIGGTTAAPEASLAGVSSPNSPPGAVCVPAALFGGVGR